MRQCRVFLSNQTAARKNTISLQRFICSTMRMYRGQMRAGERKNLVHDNRACELGVKLENRHTWDVTFLKATRIERFLSLYNSFLSDATCCC